MIDYLEIAQRHYGEIGTFAYRCFDHINKTFFKNALPTPLIVWHITAYGKCLGFTRAAYLQPTIVLHPAILGKKSPHYGNRTTDTPFGIPAQLLGYCYAYDVILHETMHVYVCYVRNYRGHESHNNQYWIDEVNRISKLLGFANINAGRYKTKRKPVPGKTTKTGKQQTATYKAQEGNLTRKEIASFPSSLRDSFFYEKDELPFVYL
jgi:hypothetical protein